MVFIHNNPFKYSKLQSQLISTSNCNNNSITRIHDYIVINACRTGNLKIIEMYLNTGHEVNQILITGWTLLLYASSYAEPTVIQYLLNLGCDPNLHHDGYTPLMALCNSSKGSADKRIKCLKYLNKAKVDVNAANKFKQTALMYACNLQNKEFILELLNNVNDINFADSKKETALFYAVANNRYDITNILVEQGADINWINYENKNAYDIAVFKGYDELLPLMNINYQANIQNNVTTNYILYWLDMFLTIKTNKNIIDNDIMSLLYGMKLESYNNLFCDLELKNFFNLTDKDLKNIGIDISAHRQKFANELFKFHKEAWKNNFLKIKSECSIVELITMLGNIKKQLTIMLITVNFSKKFLDSIKGNSELNFCKTHKQKLKFQIQYLLISVLKMKSATNLIKAHGQKINTQSFNLSLPVFIHRNTKNRRYNLYIIGMISLAMSIYILKINK